MQQSKIIEVLAKMPTRSRTKFREYVHSPFFNKHRETQKLVDYLLKYAPNFDSPKLQKKAVFKMLFPKKPYSEVQLNYVISKLLDLLSNYLAYAEYEKNEFRQKYYAIKATHTLDVPKQEASQIRKHALLQAHYPFEEATMYYEKYLYHDLLNQIHLDKKQRLYDANLQIQNNQLDYYYFAKKLQMACDMLSRNIVIQANYEPTYIQHCVALLEADGFDLEAHPAIHIYYQILKTLQSSEDEAYQTLKGLMELYANVFLSEDLLLIYDYAENFCIRKINNGETDYYHEFLDIYKQKLDKKLLFKEGYLPESDYKNIVTAGLRTKDFDWIEQFIHNNKKKLKPEIAENAFNYNLAALYYARQQYTKALRLLMTISFTDISYGVGAKTIQLQSYYELQELEPLINLIDTFRLYVMRHKTQSDYRKKANLNMLRIVKKVAKLKEKSTFISTKQFDKEKEKLEQLYAELSPLSNADWIRGIMDELEL